MKFIKKYGCAGLPLFLLLLVLIPTGCSRPEVKKIPPETVWRFIQREAPKYNLDPGFVYAIAFAESSLNAHADSGTARGIMQMSEAAWQTVTTDSYRRAWNWKHNIRMAMAYLSHCRDMLVANERFNYPLLAACYRFGPNAVRRANFNISALPPTRNRIYQQIFSGHIHAAPLPD